MTNTNIGIKISKQSIIINTVLGIGKIITGILGQSSAMIADGFHSMSDSISTIAVIIGIKISNKEADEKHPYGHERFESIFTLLLSILLTITALGVAYEGYLHIKNPVQITNIVPMIMAIISIIIKELQYQYTIHYANKIQSDLLKADAHHHRSDALSSIGALIGIILNKQGIIWADSVICFLIAICILNTAINIGINALSKITDTAIEPELAELLLNKIKTDPDVLQVDQFKTRKFGSQKYYIDTDIAVNANLSLYEAHNIADRIHNQLEKEFPNLKHIMIHINPM